MTATPAPTPPPTRSCRFASGAPRFARWLGSTRVSGVRDWRCLALAACLVVATPARAERADRDKPVNIEADGMTYDDQKQLNVFTGNVTLTKGTIVIRANRLVLRQDPAGFQYATATGTPATFRQKRDATDQFVTGTAQQLDYDGKTETVKLKDKANLKRLENDRVTDEVHGNLIVYDSRSEFFSVESGGPQAATPENPAGRVRVVIQPKSNGAPGPATVPLTPSQKLEPPGK